jgi:fatty acid desaturase
MMAAVEDTATDTRSRIKAINRAIVAEEKRLRAKHRWLAHQDAIGMGLFVGSLLAIGVLAWAYLAGHLPWWAIVLVMGLPISILHELEHDLIHGQYFKGSTRLQNFMFFVIWWSKLNASPWYRREQHLRHHRRSGQPDDAEERLIGLGVRAGLYRILIAAHPIFSWPMVRKVKRADPKWRVMWGMRQSAPALALFALVLFVQPLLHLFDALVPSVAPAGLLRIFDVLMVLWVAPNLLRQTCLALISSYSHYYGDIPENDVFRQNQIMDHPLLWPMQLYCFNFGSTHIVHHFVVQQPFYLRQMVAKVAHAEMLRQGVRRNDFGVIARANRWGNDAAAGA